MRRGFVIVLASSVVSAYACAEATDGLVPDGGSVAEAGAVGSDAGPGGPSADAAAAGDAAPPFDATTSSSSQVILNEVSAKDEWIELVNAGTSAIDVSGYLVADRDKDTGGPKISDAVTLPPGTILSPRSYVLVQGGGLDDGGKPCPAGPWSYCYNADFGISNKNGETIFFLAPDGGVVGTVVYPPDAASGDDDSYGRIPSGDPAGAFVLTESTPGAANKPR
jgi:hypothetical protein